MESVHIMGRDYHSPGVRYVFRNSEESFDRFIKNAANSGMSSADIEAARNFYRRQGDSKLEAPIMSSTKPCKEWAGVTDQVWEELLSRYSIDNLDYHEKKQLTDDLLKQGIISKEESVRFTNMLEKRAEKDANSVLSSSLEYDKEKYPTLTVKNNVEAKRAIVK